MTDFYIWEGIYTSFNQVPQIGEGFQSKTWIERSEHQLVERLTGLNTFTPSCSILSFIVSVLAAEQNKIKCLDFGGGLGHHYLDIKDTLISNAMIYYTIIEGTKSCEIAKKHLSQFHELQFLDKMPESGIKYDIVYSSSAIQYVDNWQDLLNQMINYNAAYLIFSDLVAGENKSFVTYQNYYDSKIPYRFYNLHSFISFIESSNYTLIYKSDFHANTLHKYTYLPMDNFPEDYRVGHSKNLIFKRNQ